MAKMLSKGILNSLANAILSDGLAELGLGGGVDNHRGWFVRNWDLKDQCSKAFWNRDYSQVEFNDVGIGRNRKLLSLGQLYPEFGFASPRSKTMYRNPTVIFKKPEYNPVPVSLLPSDDASRFLKIKNFGEPKFTRRVYSCNTRRKSSRIK